jgi:urease accessory protein
MHAGAGAVVESASPGRGLTGHLDLVCSVNAAGRSFLSRQSFRAPIHISKPHLDEGALVVNVVNPTAGLLEGDRIDCTVAVETGARLSLTSPSASRAHRMRSGEAFLRQEFRVAAGGWLESWPEMFIPQAGTRYRQHTNVTVEPGGGALIAECLAPGRVASGEVLAFAELAWSTDLVVSGVLVARERYRLTPEGEAAVALQRFFSTPYYASCLVVAPELTSDAPCWAAIHELHDADVCIGAGSLAGAGWVVKVVASGSVAMRRTLAAVRTQLYAALGRREPSLRRT